MISHTGLTPVRGELVGIHFESEDGPVLLIGWVVRHIERGFAIEFDHLDARTTEFVDNATAVVPSRGRGKLSNQ